MAVIAMGTHLAMRDDHPDYPALRFASYILAESTNSRLYARLRFGDALSYHVGGALRADEQDQRTSLFAYAFCAPKNADRALDALREEIRKWTDDGVAADELAESKTSYLQDFHNRLSDDAQIANLLVSGLEVDRKLAFHSKMLAKVQSLTRDDIQTALRKHLRGLSFVEIRAGDFK